jgi:phosphoenolpyruvate carboxykinase (GTP)
LNREVAAWVDEVVQLTLPDSVYWCDGSDAEYQSLERQLVASKEFLPLNPASFPGCYLYRSDPSDVARVEHVTFVCTKSREDAGPNNHWLAPAQAHRQMDDLFRGCMKGRTLYVVPYCMGPIDSPFSRCGVEITDSAYVVLNMKLMTRMGRPALERIGRDGSFVKGLPKSCRSRASVRATAATRCSARNATPCALRVGRRAPRVGSPSTC